MLVLVGDFEDLKWFLVPLKDIKEVDRSPNGFRKN